MEKIQRKSENTNFFIGIEGFVYLIFFKYFFLCLFIFFCWALKILAALSIIATKNLIPLYYCCCCGMLFAMLEITLKWYSWNIFIKYAYYLFLNCFFMWTAQDWVKCTKFVTYFFYFYLLFCLVYRVSQWPNLKFVFAWPVISTEHRIVKGCDL